MFSPMFSSSSSNKDHIQYQSPDTNCAMEEALRHKVPAGIQISSPNMNWNICQKLYDDDSSKDFKIIVGDQEFRVHRCFLTVSSPQLATLIGAGNQPGAAGVLSITNFSPKTIEEFIRFMYKGEISEESTRDPETLSGLIKFGHKFQMDHLVDYSIKLVGVQKYRFDKNTRRNFIKMAAVTIQSDKILDAILGVFKTEAFTNDSTISQNQNRPTIPPQVETPSTGNFSFGYPRLFPTTTAIDKSSHMEVSHSQPAGKLCFGNSQPSTSSLNSTSLFGNSSKNRPTTATQFGQYSGSSSSGSAGVGSSLFGPAPISTTSVGPTTNFGSSTGSAESGSGKSVKNSI